MNKKLLDAWIDKGYAVANAGDGAWSWTEKPVSLPKWEDVRYYLSALLYSDLKRDLWAFEIRQLNNAGFNKNGFPI